jgi:hypothetical protein
MLPEVSRMNRTFGRTPVERNELFVKTSESSAWAGAPSITVIQPSSAARIRGRRFMAGSSDYCA